MNVVFKTVSSIKAFVFESTITYKSFPNSLDKPKSKHFCSMAKVDLWTLRLVRLFALHFLVYCHSRSRFFSQFSKLNYSFAFLVCPCHQHGAPKPNKSFPFSALTKSHRNDFTKTESFDRVCCDENWFMRSSQITLNIVRFHKILSKPVFNYQLFSIEKSKSQKFFPWEMDFNHK